MDAVEIDEHDDSEQCHLCKYHGAANETMDDIYTYIAVSTGRVHINEICRQVKESMQSELDIEVSSETVARHIKEHMTDQRVVMGNLLLDLISIAATTKRCCTFTSEDGVSAVDPKNLMAHLKVVDQIASIYKMEDRKPVRKD